MSAPTIERYTHPCAAATQLAIEQALFESLCGHTLADAFQQLRLWQPLPALIATRAEAHRPGFERAAACARERGLPVEVRSTGGGAVCLGPASLVVSLFYSSPHNDIDLSYRRFAQLLTRAAAVLPVSLTAEHVVGAYCDGRFDLAWQGLKVGGIAQRRRVQNGAAHVWIHGVLAVGPESLHYPEAVTLFYADLGTSRVADPRQTTTLSHCLPVHAASQDLILRFSDAIVRAFDSQGTAGASL